jgi:hypothetical protein
MAPGGVTPQFRVLIQHREGGMPTPLFNILHERDDDLALLAPEGHTDL